MNPDEIKFPSQQTLVRGSWGLVKRWKQPLTNSQRRMIYFFLRVCDRTSQPPLTLQGLKEVDTSWGGHSQKENEQPFFDLKQKELYNNVLVFYTAIYPLLVTKKDDDEYYVIRDMYNSSLNTITLPPLFSFPDKTSVLYHIFCYVYSKIQEIINETTTRDKGVLLEQQIGTLWTIIMTPAPVKRSEQGCKFIDVLNFTIEEKLSLFVGIVVTLVALSSTIDLESDRLFTALAESKKQTCAIFRSKQEKFVDVRVYNYWLDQLLLLDKKQVTPTPGPPAPTPAPTPIPDQAPDQFPAPPAQIPQAPHAPAPAPAQIPQAPHAPAPAPVPIHQAPTKVPMVALQPGGVQEIDLLYQESIRKKLKTMLEKITGKPVNMDDMMTKVEELKTKSSRPEIFYEYLDTYYLDFVGTILDSPMFQQTSADSPLDQILPDKKKWDDFVGIMDRGGYSDSTTRNDLEVFMKKVMEWGEKKNTRITNVPTFLSDTIHSFHHKTQKQRRQYLQKLQKLQKLKTDTPLPSTPSAPPVQLVVNTILTIGSQNELILNKTQCLYTTPVNEEVNMFPTRFDRGTFLVNPDTISKKVRAAIYTTEMMMKCITTSTTTAKKSTLCTMMAISPDSVTLRIALVNTDSGSALMEWIRKSSEHGDIKKLVDFFLGCPWMQQEKTTTGIGLLSLSLPFPYPDYESLDLRLPQPMPLDEIQKQCLGPNGINIPWIILFVLQNLSTFLGFSSLYPPNTRLSSVRVKSSCTEPIVSISLTSSFYQSLFAVFNKFLQFTGTIENLYAWTTWTSPVMKSRLKTGVSIGPYIPFLRRKLDRETTEKIKKILDSIPDMSTPEKFYVVLETYQLKGVVLTLLNSLLLSCFPFCSSGGSTIEPTSPLTLITPQRRLWRDFVKAFMFSDYYRVYVDPLQIQQIQQQAQFKKIVDKYVNDGCVGDEESCPLSKRKTQLLQQFLDIVCAFTMTFPISSNGNIRRTCHVKFTKVKTYDANFTLGIPHLPVDTGVSVPVNAQVCHFTILNHYSDAANTTTATVPTYETKVGLFFLVGVTDFYTKPNGKKASNFVLQFMIVKGEDAIQELEDKLVALSDNDKDRHKLFENEFLVNIQMFSWNGETETSGPPALATVIPQSCGSIYSFLEEIFNIPKQGKGCGGGILSELPLMWASIKNIQANRPESIVPIIFGVFHYLSEFIFILVPFILLEPDMKIMYGDLTLPDFPFEMTVLSKLVHAFTFGFLDLSTDPDFGIDQRIKQLLDGVYDSIPELVGLLAGAIAILLMQIIQ